MTVTRCRLCGGRFQGVDYNEARVKLNTHIQSDHTTPGRKRRGQKALEAFGSEAAVSPVIGVIIMIFITVVLAAVVFSLVNDLGDYGTLECQDLADAEWQNATQAVSDGDWDAAYEHQERAEFYESLPLGACEQMEADP